LIMSSKLEDYFEPVLLSSRFKKILCDECARRGELDSLKWARSKGCEWTQPVSDAECRELLKGTGFNSRLISLIPLQMIRSIHNRFEERGSCWKMKRGTCYTAAQAGHLHIIQWARENGCEWDDETCKAAVESGHWDIARWCIDNGCECSKLMRTEILSKTS